MSDFNKVDEGPKFWEVRSPKACRSPILPPDRDGRSGGYPRSLLRKVGLLSLTPPACAGTNIYRSHSRDLLAKVLRLRTLFPRTLPRRSYLQSVTLHSEFGFIAIASQRQLSYIEAVEFRKVLCMEFSRITIEQDKMGGIPCIRGLRILVATVVGMVASGMTPEDILREYPDLEADDIREALRYAAEAVRERQLPLLKIA